MVCTDIRKLCSIIRKSDSHMKGLTSATCCQYGTIMEVSDESENDASVSRLLDDTTTTTEASSSGYVVAAGGSTSEAVSFLLLFFCFSFFACTYLYCSLFVCVFLILCLHVPVLFNLAFL